MSEKVLPGIKQLTKSVAEIAEVEALSRPPCQTWSSFIQRWFFGIPRSNQQRHKDGQLFGSGLIFAVV